MAKAPTNTLENMPLQAPQQYQIPVWSQDGQGQVELNARNGQISLVVRDAPVNHVVSVLAQNQGLNLVCAENISARISIVLHGVSLDDALTAILSTVGYTWVRTKNIVHVTSLTDGKTVPPDVQGRCLEVFPLDYASGGDVDQTVQGLLSPVGQSFLVESSSTDLRKTRDVIVVEDLPGYLQRIKSYIYQVDHPPRQVLIEAHVLEVDLKDDRRHGVNFKHVFSVLNNVVELELTGLANPGAPQALFARIGGGNLEALVECLKTTTDAKTLASPRLLVVNGQEAEIQIGEQLGYRVTTTTETSTMESVDFLDLGVVLTVTPHISRDNRVLMQVEPKVSSGRINPETELPEEETTEVRTNVLLEDGQGMVVGGLIKETDSNIQSKILCLGDLWLIGKLFQRRQVEKKRSEIIVALVPYVLPLNAEVEARTATEMMRSQTPLLHGNLETFPRPWEPSLPDAVHSPVRLLRGNGRHRLGAPWHSEHVVEQEFHPTLAQPRELEEGEAGNLEQPAEAVNPESNVTGLPSPAPLEWEPNTEARSGPVIPGVSPPIVRLPPVERRWR
jgi:type II secretory pathway component GspD/PulD (secretin)